VYQGEEEEEVEVEEPNSSMPVVPAVSLVEADATATLGRFLAKNSDVFEAADQFTFERSDSQAQQNDDFQAWAASAEAHNSLLLIAPALAAVFTLLETFVLQ
jgi:hypothetical protein